MLIQNYTGGKGVIEDGSIIEGLCPTSLTLRDTTESGRGASIEMVQVCGMREAPAPVVTAKEDSYETTATRHKPPGRSWGHATSHRRARSGGVLQQAHLGTHD